MMGDEGIPQKCMQGGKKRKKQKKEKQFVKTVRGRKNIHAKSMDKKIIEAKKAPPPKKKKK